ncbi:hypothetical protein [Methylobacillus sp.]|uniref:hypothetical protein n=1 Tax=Methylobacillus sp. TaxID=56818 RepID=UPI002FE12EE3
MQEREGSKDFFNQSDIRVMALQSDAIREKTSMNQASKFSPEATDNSLNSNVIQGCEAIPKTTGVVFEIN